MDLHWLEDFLAVIEEGGFSRAAERRNISQPAFSRRIRALEDWVGVQLFDRGTHAVALTAAGAHFRETAAETLRRLRTGRDEARAAAKGAAETLRFASTHALSLTMFPKLMRRLESQAAIESSVGLVADHTEACERLMLEGRVHFLLCHHHPDVASRLPAQQFRFVPIGTDHLVAVTAPDLAARPRPQLAYTEGSGMGRVLACLREREGRRVQGETAFASHLAGVLAAMARDGRGLAWVPRSLVEPDLAQGRLVEVTDEGEPIAIDIVVYRAKARQSPAAEAFWTRIAALDGV